MVSSYGRGDLKKMTTPLFAVTTYSYAGNGQRRSYQKPGQAINTIVWDGSDYLGEIKMAMSVVYTTINGQIVHENRGGVEAFYTPDTLGSTVALLSTTGSVTDTYTYQPYGEIVSHVGSSVTPFTFVGTFGYYLDILGSQIYVRARYLRQALTRWQTVDLLWPQARPYAYCDASPTNCVDPLGLQGIVGGVGGAGAGLVGCLIINAHFPGNTPYDDCLSCCLTVLSGTGAGVCGPSIWGAILGGAGGAEIGAQICPDLCGKNSKYNPKAAYNWCMKNCLVGCRDSPMDCSMRCNTGCEHYLNMR